MTESASSRPSPRVSLAARRRRALLGAVVVAILAVVVVVVVACGGSESAADTVSRAFGKGEAIKTAQLDAKIALTGSASGGDQPLNLAIKGPYEAGKGGRASFDLAVGLDGQAAGGADGLGLLGVGGKTYLKLGGQPFEVSSALQDDTKPKDDDKEGSGLSFSSLGVNPRAWLKDPQRVGEEDVNGEELTHVRAGVDLDRLGVDLKTLVTKAGKVAQTAAQKKETSQATKTIDRLKKDIRTARIDLWAADGEGALRRMKVDMTLSSGRVVLDLGLSKVNEPVKITAPKDALPLEQLLQAIQSSNASGKSGASADGAAGDSTGSGSAASGSGADSSASGSDTTSGSGSSTSGSDSSSSGSSTSAYDRCAAAAGTDVTKLQACADLQ